ncbi:hypothetical protein EDC04DRAFT_2902704 [Pisolithus marmoratus]|nr:hypothetical protein EDC04DRAFT_2902704 [Pisolithus marmoratus]
MIDQNTQGKPHSWRKKEINVVIADAIFHEDRQYGESYASQPARFASVVASCLVILKNKYQQHASRFKSTSEGINPNNLNYQNLHKQVLVEFPFWEECDQLWHGNPTYDARVFNTTPGADWMGDFLAIIKSGGTTAPPICDKSQVQEQGDPVGCLASSMNANWDPNPNILMDASELEEEEEEEGEADESQEGDWNMVSVSESVPEYCSNQGDFMLVDKQSDDHPPSQHQLTGPSESSQDQHLLRATLKYEHKVMKTQAYMREKEIAHLEKEHEREHSEAEKIHAQMLEQKKLDLQMLKEESELTHLKLELAKLQSQTGDASGPSTSTATTRTMHPDSM